VTGTSEVCQHVTGVLQDVQYSPTRISEEILRNTETNEFRGNVLAEFEIRRMRCPGDIRRMVIVGSVKFFFQSKHNALCPPPRTSTQNCHPHHRKPGISSVDSDPEEDLEEIQREGSS